MRMKKVLYTVLAVVVGTVLFTGYGRMNFSKASELTEDAKLMEDDTIYTSGDYEYQILEDGTIEIYYVGSKTVTELEIPGTIDGYKVSSLGGGAFYACDNLASITIPDSVTTIEDMAFEGCISLKSIELPDGVTSIGSWTFAGCDSLTSITIPKNVTSIGDCSFLSCSNLTSIEVASGNKYYTSQNGVLYNYSKTKLISWPAGKLSTSVKIPNNVTSIEGGAFAGCSSLTSITIPSGVTSIEYWTFAYCTNLKNITIPSGVTSIEQWAFAGCTGLTSITIPKSVTSIGEGTFSGCNLLTDIYYSGTMKQWKKIKLATMNEWNDGCPDNMVIHCSDGDIVTVGSVHTIGNYKYEVTKVSTGSNGMVTLTQVVKKTANVKIPATVKIKGKTYKVTAIADKVFKGNAKIKTLVIGKNVKSVGTMAFAGCTKLTKVTIGKNVTTIGDRAFYNCKKLTKIVINSKKLKTSSVGEYAFGKNKKNVTIKVPAAKLKAYKKMLYKRGISKKATII